MKALEQTIFFYPTSQRVLRLLKKSSKNLFMIVALIFILDSCARKESIIKVDSYSLPLTLHTRGSISSEGIKQMSQTKKSTINDIDTLNMIEKEIRSLTLSSDSFNYFNVRVLCEIYSSDSTNKILQINDTGYILYEDKIYEKNTTLLKLLQSDNP